VGLDFNNNKHLEAKDGNMHTRHRANYSVESASAMNNRKMRDSNSVLRGSAKNLQEIGSLRNSGSLESAMNDFSIKKNKRIHGVQLAPLHHPTA